MTKTYFYRFAANSEFSDVHLSFEALEKIGT